ncbi:MAG TPA: hypothetical protein VGE76_18030, partial [Opitutaceae bacterium]
MPAAKGANGEKKKPEFFVPFAPFCGPGILGNAVAAVRDRLLGVAYFFANASTAACWKARRTSLPSLLGK